MLITFELDGSVKPAFEIEVDKFANKKASESIKCYHLNHSDLIEDRKRVVCDKIAILYEMINAFWQKKTDGDPTALLLFQYINKALQKMISCESEYSAAARGVLYSFRTHPWVAAFLQKY